MTNLLFDLNGLHFENVYVFSKSLYHPKYKFLGNVLSATDGIGYFPFTENEDVIHPKQQYDFISHHYILIRYKEFVLRFNDY